MNRRYFLARAGVALSAMVLPFTSVANLLSKHSTDSDKLNSLKKMCAVYRDEQVVAHLRLVEVIATDFVDPKLDQRILNFTADTKVHLPEASYEISHPELGRFNVFLQTRGTLNVEQHDGLQYQACLCDLREEYRAQYPPPIA